MNLTEIVASVKRNTSLKHLLLLGYVFPVAAFIKNPRSEWWPWNRSS